MEQIKKKLSKHLRIIHIIFNLCWTSIFVAAYLWGVDTEQSSVLDLATKEAEASFDKDLVYRRWSAGHGGVYVQATEESPPNIFLKNIPERDLITPSGRKLTLVNPAYMTRQVHELAKSQYGVLGHITSLTPIRPENEPDIWEREILAKFIEGMEDFSSVEQIDGKPYLRYMKRLITEQSCLKCHAFQGYKEGDVRGGISTSVPLSEYYAIASRFKKKYIFILFPTWLVGMLLFNLGVSMLKKQVKLSEETLNQLLLQSKLLNKSQEIAQLGSWHLDIKKNTMTWSDGEYRIFGYSQGNFGESYEAFLDAIHPDDREMVDKSYSEAIANKTLYECVHRIIRENDGEVRTVIEKSEDIFDKNGTATHSFGFTQDITDKIGLELELKKYHQMISTTEELMAFIDKDYKYLAVNKAYLTAFNLSSEEIIGSTVGDLLGHDIFERYVKKHIDTCLEGKDVRYQEWFQFKSMGKRYMDVAHYTHFQTDGTVGGIVASFRDITELKEAEEESTELGKRLQQAQKMEAIGTLSGGIAHDFNNILSVMLGYAELAKEDSSPGSVIDKDLGMVIDAGNRAKNLVQQILAFSRQDNTERIPMQPAGVVKEVINMLRPSLPATIEINQDIDSATGIVLADPTQLNQILMNLCTNSFHAMEETGGKLDISLKEVSLCSEDLKHEPDVTAGTFVQFSIGDSGTGIASNIKDKIFNPFFTTKEAGKGTGMGLSMVHGIVKSFGGFITFYSELGQGTIFHVFLPVIEKEALPENKINTPIPTGKERILLVDDEELLVNMGKDMLERLGYHVTIRKSSFEALDTFQNQPDQFDLVITDQTMPGMTGVDIARRMMQIRPDIPIILCTGYSTIISEEKAKSMGIKEFALKPLSKNDIAVLIRKVLD